jgi:hypothetical protein
MVNSSKIYITYCIALVVIFMIHTRLGAACLSVFETLGESTLFYNVDNSNILESLPNSGRSVVGYLFRSSLSVKAQVWCRCTLDRFIESCLFDHLERGHSFARATKTQPIEPGNTLNSVCCAGRYPLAVLCFQRSNEGHYLHLVHS